MSSSPFVVGLVDPGGGRQSGWPRRPVDEAFRGRCVGGREDAGAVGGDRLGAAVVDGFGGPPADRGVAVLAVVPGEEPAAVRSGVLDRIKSRGELGPVL